MFLAHVMTAQKQDFKTKDSYENMSESARNASFFIDNKEGIHGRIQFMLRFF